MNGSERAAARPILTAARMRAAEERAIAAGTSVDTLMDRAGAAVARVVREHVGRGAGREVLILCGPGNNGGDGYVAARLLRDRGCIVRVAASAPPATQAARHARRQWHGDVGAVADASPAPVVVDALFGTGLTRPLNGELSDALVRLVDASRWSLAVDLPSGIDADTGALLSPVPRYRRTLALGALKPAHLLPPAVHRLGMVDVADIGVPVDSPVHALRRPRLRPPGPDDHKYTRGMVGVIGGAMPGAAALATLGAAHAGAGYIQLLGPARVPGLPHAIVQRAYRDAAELESWLGDIRIGAVVVGPGLGRDDAARAVVAAAMRSGRPLVIDADAIGLVEAPLDVPAILTPHAGEFDRAFGTDAGAPHVRAEAAARRMRAVVVLKGSTTVIAAPDGRVAISRPSAPTLATAGTGDVLSGICGTMLAQMHDPFDAACAAVWLHGRAARAIAGPVVADRLATIGLGAAVERCW